MEATLNIIQKSGQRITTQKKNVLEALQKKPQSVLQILNLIQSKKNSIDKATIYRILANFIKLGVVKEINLGGRESCYELSNCEHHHHLVCENCGQVEDVKFCEDVILKEVQKRSDFKIKNHSLEFFGTCKKCQ